MRRELLSKNFILLIFGQAASLFGNFILKLALSMYILELTGSAAIFAGILSIAMIPTILLSPFGGILADRANRRNIMVALDALTGIFVLCAVILMSKEHAIVIIGSLLIVLSVLGAFETPTVQACIPTMLTGDNITKGNAAVNQIASISYLIAPMLGSVLYFAFGLKPVMYASAGCFFITALFESFIKLDHQKANRRQSVLSVIKRDFSNSVIFIFKTKPEILKMLLLTGFSRIFVMGVTIVGLPYIVRSVLELNAKYYGAAESALAVATILGSVFAGALVGKLHFSNLSSLLIALGFFIFPAGIAFLLPVKTLAKYIIIVIAFCGMQIAISIFSIFAVSFIQQRTPDHLIGKVMAYAAAITMCAQPIGQMAYGFLFDTFSGAVCLVLIPTGIIACAIGLLSKNSFAFLE